LLTIRNDERSSQGLGDLMEGNRLHLFFFFAAADAAPSCAWSGRNHLLPGNRILMNALIPLCVVSSPSLELIILNGSNWNEAELGVGGGKGTHLNHSISLVFSCWN
jgi:hypothetical protein